MKKLILYDFDGVIVDSFAVSLGILKKKNPQITDRDYRDCFLGNFYDARVKGRSDIIWGSPDEFFPRYAEQLMQTPPVPGITSAIQEFTKEFSQIIVTSTINSPVREYLRAYNLDQYFKAVFGKEAGHSKTDKIRDAVARFGARVENAIFITDTLGDLKEANAAGIRSIAVTWGFHDRATLENGNPQVIISAVPELMPTVRKLLG